MTCPKITCKKSNLMVKLFNFLSYSFEYPKFIYKLLLSKIINFIIASGTLGHKNYVIDLRDPYDVLLDTNGDAIATVGQIVALFLQRVSTGHMRGKKLIVAFVKDYFCRCFKRIMLCPAAPERAEHCGGRRNICSHEFGQKATALNFDVGP